MPGSAGNAPPPAAIAYERKLTYHVYGVRIASRNPNFIVALQIHSDRHHMTARLSRADTEKLIAALSAAIAADEAA